MDQEIHERASYLEAGMDDDVSKPIEQKKLVQAIARALSKVR